MSEHSDEHYGELDEENHRLRDATPRDVLAAHDNLERLRSAGDANRALNDELEMRSQLHQDQLEAVTAELTLNLRDQFAQAALASMSDDRKPVASARWAYAVADAMLEARKT